MRHYQSAINYRIIGSYFRRNTNDTKEKAVFLSKPYY